MFNLFVDQNFISEVRMVLFWKLLSPLFTLCIFIRSGKKGSLLIDSSTVDPHASKTVAALAEAQGNVFIDAPVSGGEVLV